MLITTLITTKFSIKNYVSFAYYKLREVLLQITTPIWLQITTEQLLSIYFSYQPVFMPFYQLI